jgi:hypothetical protein
MDKLTEMDRCRGSVMLGSQWDEEATKMYKFLAIFHPEMPLDKRMKMVYDERRKQEKRGLL